MKIHCFQYGKNKLIVHNHCLLAHKIMCAVQSVMSIHQTSTQHKIINNHCHKCRQMNILFKGAPPMSFTSVLVLWVLPEWPLKGASPVADWGLPVTKAEQSHGFSLGHPPKI